MCHLRPSSAADGTLLLPPPLFNMCVSMLPVTCCGILILGRYGVLSVQFMG